MQKISDLVAEIIENDDMVREVAAKGLLNSMSFARVIQPRVEAELYKKVKLGSIAAAVLRYVQKTKPITLPSEQDIRQISVQTGLNGITYERSEEVSKKIQKIYNEINVNNKTYLTVTQGITEITIIGETSIINAFRDKLKQYKCIYDITDIIGISVKFDLKYMEIPNLFYLLIRKLALKNINIIEIVSTATELTFIINKKDMQASLEQLQKGL